MLFASHEVRLALRQSYTYIVYIYIDINTQGQTHMQYAIQCNADFS